MQIGENEQKPSGLQQLVQFARVNDPLEFFWVNDPLEFLQKSRRVKISRGVNDLLTIFLLRKTSWTHLVWFCTFLWLLEY